MKTHLKCWIVLLCGLVLIVSGCASQQNELQQIAKGWCMTIRASQVIPVYPLTEDIQPGDVFLVQMPVDSQHKQYDKDGFLPFDNHIARINPSGYMAFYQNSFGLGGEDLNPIPKALFGGEKNKLWIAAPQAGFPTYSVSVQRGGGFSAALPIASVPIGLSLLGAEAASATVTIDKARTIGVDTMSLHADVASWATQPASAALLASFAPGEGRQNYLRVISRIYVTGRLVVNLTADTASSAGITGGAAKPVELFTLSTTTADKPGTAKSYANAVDKVNESLTNSLSKAMVDGVETDLPGASIKVAAASSRSITVTEDFIDRPLVIGYLGFDYAIRENGQLGPPIPTYAVVEQQAIPESKPFFTASQEQIIFLRESIQVLADASKRWAVAAGGIGPDFLQSYESALQSESTPMGAFNSTLRYFLATEPSGSGPRHFVALVALQRAATADVADSSSP